MNFNVYEAASDIITEFRTHKVSADEILSRKLDYLVPIPFKTREEIRQETEVDRKDGLFQGDVIPQIDLKVLHYFATQLCLLRYPHLINALDETSLITLGLLVEQWVENYLQSYTASSGLQSPEQNGDSETLESEGDYDFGFDDEDDGEEISDDDYGDNDDDDNDKDGDDDDKGMTYIRMIGRGPSEQVSKLLNYHDSPADI